MNEKAKITQEYLSKLAPLTFMEDDLIGANFMDKYKLMHSNISDEIAEDFYNQESFFFKQQLLAGKDLTQCTVYSLYGCFMDILVNGLSFEPASKLLYITSKNVNAAPKGQPDRWEKRAINNVSPYGELAIRIRVGQLKYADDPVIVYEGDFWEPGYNEAGFRYCLYRAKIPRDGKRIIGSFIKLHRPDGSFDFPFFTEENIEEWKKASANQNKNSGANALYSDNNNGINIGFLKAKTIKHSFKALTRVKVQGTSTALEDDQFNASEEFLTDTPSAEVPKPAGQPVTSNTNGQENNLKTPPPLNGASSNGVASNGTAKPSAPPPLATGSTVKVIPATEPGKAASLTISDPTSPF